MRGMILQTPDDAFLRRIGLVVFLVAEFEGLLMYNPVRFHSVLPPELRLVSEMSLTIPALTTSKLGEYFVAHAKNITESETAAYYDAGGRALIEIGPKRNAVLHSRPGVDGTDPQNKLRLIRMRPDLRSEKYEAFKIDDLYLDGLVSRIVELRQHATAVRHAPPT